MNWPPPKTAERLGADGAEWHAQFDIRDWAIRDPRDNCTFGYANAVHMRYCTRHPRRITARRMAWKANKDEI